MTENSTESIVDPRIGEFLKLARVAHLATTSAAGAPHNIPLCFWFDEISHFYFVIDEKPKRDSALRIKRMRNIAENPRVALVVDHYEEDWAALAYVLVHGDAAVVEDQNEYMLALRNLRDKYPQYRTMGLTPANNPIVRIDAQRFHAWGARFNSVTG